MATDRPAAVALAILRVAGGYALQLRDNRPDVAAAGHWALFGGSIEGQETPANAIRREIREELELDVADWQELWRVRYYVPLRDAAVLHIIFTADVTDTWARHVLHEGQAAGSVSDRWSTAPDGARRHGPARALSRPGCGAVARLDLSRAPGREMPCHHRADDTIGAP